MKSLCLFIIEIAHRAFFSGQPESCKCFTKEYRLRVPGFLLVLPIGAVGQANALRGTLWRSFDSELNGERDSKVAATIPATTGIVAALKRDLLNVRSRDGSPKLRSGLTMAFRDLDDIN